ncbi:MAG: hypothetical protein QXX94_07085 [Candidatus Bathyarchaeia archaeon]
MGKYREYFLWLTIFLLGAIWFLTVISTSLYSIEPEDLGLVSKLPPYFWVGLALLCVVFYVGRDSKKYLSIAFVFVILYLFAAPTLIKEPVWLSNSFYPFAESILINNFSHLFIRSGAPLFSYIRWPLFIYFSSALTLATGIPDILLLKFFPLLTISLFGLLILSILKEEMDFHHAVFGAAWFLSSFWLRQQYFGPQSLAYIFFLLLFLVISRGFLNNDDGVGKRRFVLLLAYLFTAIILTHALTAIMSLISLIALYLSQRLITKSNTISTEVFLLILTIFLASALFFLGTFSLIVNKVYSSLSAITGLSIYREPSRIIGSSANQLNYLSSWSIVILNVLAALPSLLILLKRILFREELKKEEFGIFSASLLCLFGVFALTMKYGHHEAYQRAFMFGLLPLTYLSIKSLRRKPKILVGFLSIIIFLNIPAQYGSDSFRIAADSHLAGAKFTANSIPDKSSCFDELSFYIRYYAPLKRIRYESLSGLPYTSFPNATKVSSVLSKTRYVALSSLLEKYYLYYLGKNPLDQVDLNGLNRIYDNGNFSLLKN